MRTGLSPTAVALFLFVPFAHAATIIVTSQNDNGAGSLRAAVSSASSGDTITFDPSLGGKTITLTSGEIVITKALTINGPGAHNLAISGNHASRIFNTNAAVTISGLTLTNGQTTGDGGAIVASGKMTLIGDALTGNHSQNNGGAAASRFGATFTISDSTFSNNTSEFLSGALYTDGNPNSIVRSTFSGNSVLNEGVGGAIFNDGTLSISQSTISNNSAIGESSLAGGIYSDGSVTITDSTLSGNSADAGGEGGGFYNAGTVTFRNSTVSGNSCGDATIDFESQGAGIFNEARSTVTIINSSVANNTTGTGSQGAGIYNNGTLNLSCSTIAGNANGAGGTAGGIFNNAGTVTAANTIIARNSANAAADFFGALASQGFNLIGDTTGSSGAIASDMINVDPKLGPLQNNGGFTQTMALLFGSPAIDHGDPAFNPNAFNPPINTDQHGLARVINGVIDVGSFEADVPHFPSIDNMTSAQTLECASYQGTNASVTASFSDNKGHALTVQWFVNNQLKQTDQIPGTQPTTRSTSSYSSTFPLGTTTVLFSVTDGQSDPVTQSTTVTVVDTTPPAILNVCASPNILSPPNHKMVAVKVTAPVRDVCDPNPKCKIVSVTSNEPGPGEYQITGNLTLNLQSERNGNGNGRCYTITVEATDASGNSARKTVTVKVPRCNGH
jgi:hypothetical protein